MGCWVGYYPNTTPFPAPLSKNKSCGTLRCYWPQSLPWTPGESSCSLLLRKPALHIPLQWLLKFLLAVDRDLSRPAHPWNTQGAGPRPCTQWHSRLCFKTQQANKLTESGSKKLLQCSLKKKKKRRVLILKIDRVYLQIIQIKGRQLNWTQLKNWAKDINEQFREEWK